jgi:hypothetical protein
VVFLRLPGRLVFSIRTQKIDSNQPSSSDQLRLTFRVPGLAMGTSTALVGRPAGGGPIESCQVCWIGFLISNPYAKQTLMLLN